MPQKGLHRADVDAAFQQVSGEGVAQGVAGGAFGDAGFFNSGFELTLQGMFMEVMPSDSAGSRVGTKVGRWKKVLPTPLSGGVRVFATQGFRQMHVAKTGGSVLLMTQSHGFEVTVKSVLQVARQRHDSMLAAFGVMNRQRALAEIQILDAQSQSLHLAQTTAIKQ